MTAQVIPQSRHPRDSFPKLKARFHRPAPPTPPRNPCTAAWQQVFLTVLRHLPFCSELGYPLLSRTGVSDGGGWATRAPSPGSAFWKQAARRDTSSMPPPMSLGRLPWAPASSTPARRRTSGGRQSSKPTLLRWLPRGLARGRAAQTHPGRGQAPAGGPVSPLRFRGLPKRRFRAHLLGRNPGMRMFSKHARRLRVRALDARDGNSGAGLSLGVQVLVRHTLPHTPPPPKNKTKG